MEKVKYIETKNNRIATYQGLSVSTDKYNASKSVALSIEKLNEVAKEANVTFYIKPNFLTDSQEIYFSETGKLRFSKMEGLEHAISFLELNHKGAATGGLIFYLERDFKEFSANWAALRSSVLGDEKIAKLLQVIDCQIQKKS